MSSASVKSEISTVLTGQRIAAIREVANFMKFPYHLSGLTRMKENIKFVFTECQVFDDIDPNQSSIGDSLDSITDNDEFVSATKSAMFKLVESSMTNVKDFKFEQASSQVKKLALLKSFILDEVSFLKSLRFFIERVFAPMKAYIVLRRKLGMVNNLISSSELVDLSANLEDLYELSNFLYSNCMNEITEENYGDIEFDFNGNVVHFELDGDHVDAVADVLCKYWKEKSAMLLIYLFYISNHRRYVKLVMFLKNFREEFAMYTDIQFISAFEDLDVSEILMLPVIRFLQYFHFFEELGKLHKKATDKRAVQIYENLSDILFQSHLRKFSIHARMRTAYIQEKLFGGLINLVNEDRYFIRSSFLSKSYNNTQYKVSKDKDYSFFLFNDLIFYAEAATSVLKVKHAINLSSVTKVVEMPEVDDCTFKIESPKKVLILRTSDSEQKKAWINDIDFYSALRKEWLALARKNEEDAEYTIISGARHESVKDIGAKWFKVTALLGMTFYFESKTGVTSLSPPTSYISLQDSLQTSVLELVPSTLKCRQCEYKGCKRMAMKFCSLFKFCVEHSSFTDQDLKGGELEKSVASKLRNEKNVYLKYLPNEIHEKIASTENINLAIKRKPNVKAKKVPGKSAVLRESYAPPVPEDDHEDSVPSEQYKLKSGDQIAAAGTTKNPFMSTNGKFMLTEVNRAENKGAPRKSSAPEPRTFADAVKKKYEKDKIPPLPQVPKDLKRPGNETLTKPLSVEAEDLPDPIKSKPPSIQGLLKKPVLNPSNNPPDVKDRACTTPSPKVEDVSAVTSKPQSLRNSAGDIANALESKPSPKVQRKEPPIPPKNLKPKPDLKPKPKSLKPAASSIAPHIMDEKDSEDYSGIPTEYVNSRSATMPQKMIREEVKVSEKPAAPLSFTRPVADSLKKGKPALNSYESGAEIKVQKKDPRSTEARKNIVQVELNESERNLLKKDTPLKEAENERKTNFEKRSAKKEETTTINAEESKETKILYNAKTGEPTTWFRVWDESQKRFFFWNDSTEASMWTMPEGLRL